MGGGIHARGEFVLLSRSNFAIFITKCVLRIVSQFSFEVKIEASEKAMQQLPGIEPRTPGLCSQMTVREISSHLFSRVLTAHT